MPGNSSASSIALDISASSTFLDGRASAEIVIKNAGDAQAYSLNIEATLTTNSVSKWITNSLATNEIVTATLDLGVPPELPGVYTIAIKIFYEDSNGYQSTAVDAVPLLTGDPGEIKSTVRAKLMPARINHAGQIKLHLSTTGHDSVKVSITPILPTELSATPDMITETIIPGKSNVVNISISNLGAIEGSRYPITVIIDYNEQQLHRSTTARSMVLIPGPLSSTQQFRKLCAVTALLLIIAFGLMQVLTRWQTNDSKTFINKNNNINDRAFSFSMLAIILGFIAWHIPMQYIMMNTTTTGGDIPAHNYLASHLKTQLFQHGRIISWANGWWCGFPMFQYYFCLPYLLIAILSSAIPFNIAFKIISVLGIYALPVSAWASARIMRLPKPTPTLMATACIPILFTNSHTMWGVNIYSTFAGMISNSISFPLMLLFIACSWRDADDGQFRIITVTLLILTIASHFFTSVIAILCITSIPFLKPGAGLKRAARILAGETLLALLLMSWWILPLILKSEFCIEFGTNWNIRLGDTVPIHLLLPLALLSVTAIAYAIRNRMMQIVIFAWMFVCSILLYHYGTEHIAPVFVNVRLWPFLFFSILALGAAGGGMAIANLRHSWIAVLAIVFITLAHGVDIPNNVRSWAKWNYEGMENKKRWQLFKELIEPLRGSEGRLANDLHEHNHSFGSTRIFESIPHLTGKPILEGGLVNSAVGSMFSYYIQGETSRNCAGFPNIVIPPEFNFDNATRHLSLFNVKHFIAKSQATKAALASSSDWKLVKTADQWELYELLSNNGKYITPARNQPVAVRLSSSDKSNWQKAGLEWIYSSSLIDQPFVFLRGSESGNGQFKNILSEKEFMDYCHKSRAGGITAPIAGTALTNVITISEEKITDNAIRFKTDGIGLPHLIKYSYFPNWKVKGARKVFMVSPCFMLVYPEKENVELIYSRTTVDYTGMSLSGMGIIVLLALAFSKFNKRQKKL